MQQQKEIKNVAIVGAGIGGIATSIRLASQGFQVQVFESNTYPGGKLTEIKQDGFRFDAGPSLFTEPHLVDELYSLAKKDPKKHFRYSRLPVLCRYHFANDKQFSASADPVQFANDLEKTAGEPASNTIKHLKRSRYIYDQTAYLFLERSLHKLKSYLSLRVLKSTLNLPFLGVFGSMGQHNEKQFSTPEAKFLFNRYATYNGSNPYKAPALLNIIPHLEFNRGAYFPEAGMHNITKSLYKLAEELGVQFHFSSPVEEILLSDKRVKGIRTNGKNHLADLVVCNSDVHFVYNNLLPGFTQPKKTSQLERSSSALIFYWGIGRPFPELELHNIFFSADYKNEFTHIFEEKQTPEDPTIYVNITCKENPKDAPEGKENWFVMINVPANTKEDWGTDLKAARSRVIKKLSAMLKCDVEGLIETEEILDPIRIERKTGSYQGSLYGTSSNNRMSAFFRHPNFSRQVQGLYFCGGSVHPGGGIPLALSSAKIVADLISKRKG